VLGAGALVVAASSTVVELPEAVESAAGSVDVVASALTEDPVSLSDEAAPAEATMLPADPDDGPLAAIRAPAATVATTSAATTPVTTRVVVVGRFPTRSLMAFRVPL